MVTEVGTGLGLLGPGDLDQVLAERSPVMRSLSPEDWDSLAAARAGGAFDSEFHAAWENGRAFLAARDGLRGRLPEAVEWKGSIRGSGDEVAPIDLRIDHVYLVSCKYLSNILFNASPSHVFDDLLLGGPGRRGRGTGGDWYAEVAPEPYQALYDTVRRLVQDEVVEGALLSGGGAGGVSALARPIGSLVPAPALPGLEVVDPGGRPDRAAPAVARPAAAVLGELPMRAVDLTSAQRMALSDRLKSGWPGQAKAAYRELSDVVAQASANRWRGSLSGAGSAGAGEAMLWRLLRMGSAPYFVLGSSPTQSLRLRIATPWDWRQLFALVRFEVFAQAGGQPRVGWLATVRERASGQLHEVAGHVEVRWSHGRFGGLPEAKGYLDTRHQLVPGYVPLR
jgi:hypothetical protein